MCKFKAYPCLQMVQRVMKSEVVDKHWKKKGMLDDIRHQPSLHVTLSGDDGCAISL